MTENNYRTARQVSSGVLLLIAWTAFCGWVVTHYGWTGDDGTGFGPFMALWFGAGGAAVCLVVLAYSTYKLRR